MPLYDRNIFPNYNPKHYTFRVVIIDYSIGHCSNGTLGNMALFLMPYLCPATAVCFNSTERFSSFTSFCHLLFSIKMFLGGRGVHNWPLYSSSGAVMALLHESVSQSVGNPGPAATFTG